jgi:hypothetical protein
MDLSSLAGAKQLRDTRSGSMPAPVRKHQSRGWNGSNRVGGITTVFREHYKQLGSHCAPSSTRTTSTA